MPASSATPAVRWLRALVVALVASAIGIVAHVSAGGVLPGFTAMLLLVGVLATVSAVALGHQAGYVAIVVLVAGGQLLVHLVLTALTGHPGTQPSHGLGHDAAGAGTPHWVEHLRDDLTGPNLVMALAHLAAAAGVAAWLLAGERALWALIALWDAHVVARLTASYALTHPDAATGLSTLPGRRALEAVAGVVRRRRAATNGATRRGPPAPLAPLLDASTP